MYNKQTYRGKICVITGAASGIGRALAISLADAGAVLAISDVAEDELAETFRLIGGEKSNTILMDKVDVADNEDVESYAPHVQASLGAADYVFNVAGLTRIGNFDEIPISSMEKVVDVNFWGAVRMCKAFLPQLKSTKGGIVNIASLFSLIGVGGQTHYCASKFALRGFSETLVQELDGDDVRVSVVCPGAVDTNITRNATIDVLPERAKSHEHINNMFKKIAHTSAQEAAQIILDGVAKGKLQILVGKDARRAALMQRLLPQYYVKLMIKQAQKGKARHLKKMGQK